MGVEAGLKAGDTRTDRVELLITKRDHVGSGDLELQYPKGKQRTEAEEQAAWSRVVPRQERIARAMPRSGRAWFNLGFAELRAKGQTGTFNTEPFSNQGQMPGEKTV